MMQDDGWETVTDPNEMKRARLPKAPRSTGKVSPQDAKALAAYRDLADSADVAFRTGRAFDSQDDKFKSGKTKAEMFGMMYPDTSVGGILGAVKGAGGSLLRGTMGYMYPNQDHARYQYLRSQAAALNNAGLRLNKGVQTEGDATRIAYENAGVDKAPAVNKALIQQVFDNAAVAQARNNSASKWMAANGSLNGTTNSQGQTYDEYFTTVVRPQALAVSRAQRGGTKTPPATDLRAKYGLK